MKVLVFSDSHGDVETLCGVVEKEMPDQIVHLGDCIGDAEQLRGRYPGIDMIAVLGNVDSDREDEEWIQFAEICGKHLIITHGHTFITEYVNNEQTDRNRIASRKSMLKAIRESNADILLHGHTHEPTINRTQATPGKNCWIMNPGSISRRVNGALRPTYGILSMDESGAVQWQFVEVE